jgi:hypothetical protein
VHFRKEGREEEGTASKREQWREYLKGLLDRTRRIPYSVYDVRHHFNPNVLENPERVGKKHQDTSTLSTPKSISTVGKSICIAIEIGNAENTYKVVADTQKTTHNISPYMRRTNGHHVEITLWKDARGIEIPNSIDQNRPSPRERTARKSRAAPTQSTQPLVLPFFEPATRQGLACPRDTYLSIQ